MKIALLAFSERGKETGEKLVRSLRGTPFREEKALESTCGEEPEVRLFVKCSFLADSISESATEWTGRRFAQGVDALVFIGACGIAVRCIAPWIRDKAKDPAVLVIDESGAFVISLLSGHLGGANELATNCARALEAIPVITTATDMQGCFAVDAFARENGCRIFPLSIAKEVSAALLCGREVGLYSEFPLEGAIPRGLRLVDTKEEISLFSLGIAITALEECRPFERTVFVVPPVLALGMGCRKEIGALVVQREAAHCLEGYRREALFALASLDRKKEERALQRLAEAWGVPFWTYSAAQLCGVEGNFNSSAYVEKITGVDNVCERSAVYACMQKPGSDGAPGRQKNAVLIRPKHAGDGVTSALAMRKDYRLFFR